MSARDERDRFLGCLIGLAVGDALGTTVEFQPRGSFEPVTDVVGGGPFSLSPGEWTDDTSMALCLATSLLEVGGFDPRDQVERYCLWQADGYLSSNGTCFDIGNTVAAALARYRATGDPYSGSTDERAAGNGSIMRLAPVPMFYFPDLAAAVHHSGDSSRTTHGARECVDACRLFAAMLCRALAGDAKADVLDAIAATGPLAPAIARIARGSYADKTAAEVRGTGYVVDSLEAALWCFQTTDDYATAVIAAANLGDDADTTAAICGQLAGAHYGLSNIPPTWLAKLASRDHIEHLADRLWQANR